MDEAALVRLRVEICRTWIRDLFCASGLSIDHAEVIAEVYIRSSLRGVGHHELDMVPQRLEWLRVGGVNPRPVSRTLYAQGAMEVLHGDRGLGEYCTMMITKRALELASVHGMALVSVRNSNHFLAAAPYLELVTEHGMVGLLWSNTDATMRYPGGTKAILGNNPFGFGIPSQGVPWVFDACMAYASLGTLRALASQEQPVPEYWGTDSEGKPSSDPRAILQGGSISPMGEHKGFSLGLLGEAMTGLLSGGPTADEVQPGGGINTHNQTILVIRPPQLPMEETREPFQERTLDLEGRLKASQPGLRVPGERSARVRRESLDHGIPCSKVVWEKLQGASVVLGIPCPSDIFMNS